MGRVSREPLTAEQAAALDARYRPFPAFAEWPSAPFRPDLWDAALGELDALRADAAEDDVRRALDVTMRAAAFETGAVEGLYETTRGLTRTVAIQAAMWENAVESSSPDALALFRAQLSAYELVLDAATTELPVTEAWIRRLHEELTGPQETYAVETPVGRQEQPLPRGEYKRYPNHVELDGGRVHAYAPVGQTRSEMARLVEELRSAPFEHAHPVVQAAYSHYALVAIHPFADGNGRVARALSSVYLYRAAGVPLLLHADQRADYFRALALVDDGDPLPFARLVEDLARSAVALVADTLRAALAPDPDAALAGFRDLLTAHGGLTFEEVEAAATALADQVVELIGERIARLELPAGVRVQVVHASGGQLGHVSPGFRGIAPSVRQAVIRLEASDPANVAQAATLNFLIARQPDDAEAFRVEDNESQDGVTLAVRDVAPALTAPAQHRIEAFVERVLGQQLTQLLEQARRNFEQSRYS
jgi:Fic family protein